MKASRVYTLLKQETVQRADRNYSWKDKRYGLVLPKGFIVSYRIAKCIREIRKIWSNLFDTIYQTLSYKYCNEKEIQILDGQKEAVH